MRRAGKNQKKYCTLVDARRQLEYNINIVNFKLLEVLYGEI